MLAKIKASLQASYDAGENIEVVKRLVEPLLRPGIRILDVGPGTGALIHHVREAARRKGFEVQLHVLDYLPSVLDRFPDDVHAHLFNLHELADTSEHVQRMPLDDASFDVVVFTEVIEHITFPQEVVSEFARVLAPGGRLVITTPNIFCLGNRLATFLGTDKLFRKVGEEGFVATIEFSRFGHVAHYSHASLAQLLSPWFAIETRTGSCFKIPLLRFWQTRLAAMFPTLANHVVYIATKTALGDTSLRVVPCVLTGATERTLPDGRCLHPVPHNAVCHGCRHFHTDWLHPRDRRKKASYRPR